MHSQFTDITKLPDVTSIYMRKLLLVYIIKWCRFLLWSINFDWHHVYSGCFIIIADLCHSGRKQEIRFSFGPWSTWWFEVWCSCLFFSMRAPQSYFLCLFNLYFIPPCRPQNRHNSGMFSSFFTTKNVCRETCTIHLSYVLFIIISVCKKDMAFFLMCHHRIFFS